MSAVDAVWADLCCVVCRLRRFAAIARPDQFSTKSLLWHTNVNYSDLTKVSFIVTRLFDPLSFGKGGTIFSPVQEKVVVFLFWKKKMASLPCNKSIWTIMSLNMWSFANGDMQVFHQQVFTTLHHTINVAYHFQNVSTRSGCLQWGFVVRMGTLAVYRSRPDPRERRAPAVWFPLPVPLPAPPPKGNSASAAFQLKTCPVGKDAVAFGSETHNISD